MTDLSRAAHRVYRACPNGNWHVRFGLRREATQHREGCWRTDDRRSPHRMMCGGPAWSTLDFAAPDQWLDSGTQAFLTLCRC